MIDDVLNVRSMAMMYAKSMLGTDNMHIHAVGLDVNIVVKALPENLHIVIGEIVFTAGMKLTMNGSTPDNDPNPCSVHGKDIGRAALIVMNTDG